jgi:two-component system, sensor histidine kinase
MRVLIADDDVDGAEVLGLLFEWAGCDVRVVHSGYDAVLVAPKFKPDLIVLDINMPGMDGFEAAAALREQPSANEAVYVAHTSLTETAMTERAKNSSSFAHYVQKPSEFARFEAILASTPSRGSAPARVPDTRATLR